jgi:glycosyltransferase involved in cell wall biosynthesis
VRIGLVVTGGVDRSGRERVIPALLSLIERLARRHDLHVFALRHYQDACSYPLLGATVHDLGRSDSVRGLGRFRQARRLLAAVRQVGSFDVLHGYWGVPAGAATVDVAWRLGVPAVVTFDSGELVSLPDVRYGLQRRWIDRRAVARVVRRAARITVCSGYMERLAAARGIDVVQVPIGVDPARFSAGPRAEGPPWRLLQVASLNPVKDQATLLRAMARIVSKVPDVHLDIVGGDTLGGCVQALSRTLGLDAHVTFHGFQPTEQLRAFYARAHLHVVSSRHEAANVAALEAACAGVPTVGTTVGYIADRAPDAAVAVPVGDAEALASAVAGLLRDRDRRAQIAAAAGAWAETHDADWSAGEFERIYNDVAVRRFAQGDARL